MGKKAFIKVIVEETRTSSTAGCSLTIIEKVEEPEFHAFLMHHECVHISPLSFLVKLFAAGSQCCCYMSLTKLDHSSRSRLKSFLVVDRRRKSRGSYGSSHSVELLNTQMRSLQYLQKKRRLHEELLDTSIFVEILIVF